MTSEKIGKDTMWLKVDWSGGRRGLLMATALVLSLGAGQAQAAEDELPGDLLMGGEDDRPLFEEDGRIWWAGWQLFLARDQMTGEQPVGYDWGMGLNIPVNMELYRGLGMRLQLGLTYSGSPPMNEAQIEINYAVPPEEEGMGATELPKTVDGFFGAIQLAPSLTYTKPLLEGSVNPYGGFGPALILAYCFPDIEAEDSVLLDYPPGVEPPDSGVESIDPFSVNLAPGVNAFFGVNFMLARSLHLNVEANYVQANMVETRLEKAKEGYNATRTAFVYSALTLSTGLIWHF